MIKHIVLCTTILAGSIVAFAQGGISYQRDQSATQAWVISQGYSTGGGGVPAGVIILIATGTCPATYTEVTALDGKMLRGTTAAHGDVGTTGGNATITPTGTVSQPTVTMNSYTPAGANGTVSFTPAGTIAWPVGVPTAALTWPAGVPTFTGTAGTVPAQTFTGSSATTSAVSAGTPAGTNSTPTFTGSALATHQHELPFQDPSAAGTTNFRGINPTTFGTGTSRAGVWGITTTSSTTSAAVAMSQAVSAGTPAGTVSASTFTGSALGTHTHTVTATGTNETAVFTPAGTIAWPAGVPTAALTWPAGVPTLSGSSGTVPAETFTGTPATLTGTVSQSTFTGNAVDPSPSYTNVIFCSKN